LHKAPRRPSQSTSAADLAAHFDVDERSIRRWVTAGCPVVDAGKPGHRAPTFDLAAVEEWRKGQVTAEQEMTAALIRRLDAQSASALRVLEQLEATHIPADEVTEVWAGECRRVAARLQRIPAELGAALTAIASEGPAAIEEAMDRHVRQVLTELSDPDADVPAVTSPRPEPRQVRRSTTLRQARAQLADLQATVLTTRQAIAAGTEALRARERTERRRSRG
jgi:phage terminase Nu1 subunit (DNA packaging protein)